MTVPGKFPVLLIVRTDLVGVSRLPQVLENGGCAVNLFSPPEIAITRSRYVSRRIPAPRGEAPFLESLKNHLQTHRDEYDWIIIGDETVLHALAGESEQAWAANVLPVPARGRAPRLITSKFEFLQAAAEAGLPVPELRICADLSDAAQTAARMEYPVILKLPVSAAGSGVRQARNAEELLQQYKVLADGQAVAVQKFIEGKIGLTEVLYDRGTPICWASAYKRRCWPTEFSASCVREVMDHAEIAPLIAGIGALTGYHGFGGVDWIHDPATDRLHLVEFNARPTPGYHLGHAAGVDFAEAVRGMLRGEPRPLRPSPEFAGRTLHMFPQSLHLAVDERSPRMVFPALRDLPWRDPGLLTALLRRFVSHYLPSDLRARARAVRQRHAH